MNSGFGGSGGGGVPSGTLPRMRAVFAEGAKFSDGWEDADVAAASRTRKAVVNGFMGKDGLVSFLVDGEFKSRNKSTAIAFSHPRKVTWTCATAPPAVWSVWRHRCGRCRPLVERLIRRGECLDKVLNGGE